MRHTGEDVASAAAIFMLVCLLIAAAVSAVQNIKEQGYDEGRRDECERQNPGAVECIKIDGWWEPVVVQPN